MQDLDDVLVAPFFSPPFHGRVELRVANRWIGAPREQQLNGRSVAVDRRPVQSGSAEKPSRIRIGATLEQKMMVKWTEEASSAREIEVVAKGVQNSKMISEITRVIKEEIRGVESIRLRRRQGGAAYFTVRVRARASDFGHDLEQKSFSNFKLQVDDVTRTKIVVSLNR